MQKTRLRLVALFVVGPLLLLFWLFGPWVRSHWPPFSSNWDLPFGTLTDVVGIGLAGVILVFTIWVARRQIRIMNRQTTLSEKQIEIAKEQERAAVRMQELAEEQARIAKRQGEIAEIQHEMLTRKAELAMEEGESLFHIPDNRDIRRLEIRNNGTLRSEAYEWKIWISTDVRGFYVAKDPRLGLPLEPVLTRFGPDDKTFEAFEGSSVGPLHPRLTHIALTLEKINSEDIEVFWMIESEQGRFPGEGNGRLFLAGTPMNEDEEAVD